MARILLTGAGGFFGVHAQQLLTAAGHTVIPASRNPEQYLDSACGNPYIKLEISDQKNVATVSARIMPDVIIHAAAISDPGECELNPVRATEVNVVGAGYVFSVAAALGIPFIFLSSDLVFSGERGEYNEHNRPEPRTEYGRTKLRFEEMLIEQRLHFQWVVLRSSLMFGNAVPGHEGYPGFALRMLRKGDSPRLFYDQYRTPVFVDDVVEAILLILDRELYGELLHVGGPERINRPDFVRRYCRAADIDDSNIIELSMDDMPDYRTRVRDVSLSSLKLQRLTGWQPRSLEEAFALMVARKAPESKRFGS